jgi:hypothetical protein
MTLQLLRPDIRQSFILLVAVNSWANHNPTASNTTAIANPAIAGRRFSPFSGSSIATRLHRPLTMTDPTTPALLPVRVSEFGDGQGARLRAVCPIKFDKLVDSTEEYRLVRT